MKRKENSSLLPIFGGRQFCWLVMEVIGKAPDVMMLVVTIVETMIAKSSAGRDDDVRARA